MTEKLSFIMILQNWGLGNWRYWVKFQWKSGRKGFFWDTIKDLGDIDLFIFRPARFSQEVDWNQLFNDTIGHWEHFLPLWIHGFFKELESHDGFFSTWLQVLTGLEIYSLRRRIGIERNSMNLSWIVFIRFISPKVPRSVILEAGFFHPSSTGSRSS